MKTCFKCGNTAPLSEFYRHPRMADGHVNKCKTCAKADALAHRSEHLEEARANDRTRAKLPQRVKQRVASNRKYRAAHRKRAAANDAVAKAISRGKLKPWPVCFMPECSGKPVAHHPDYNRPLDVVWLCSIHHSEVHQI